MGSTNKTPNFDLSQFEPGDVPQWQADYNADMEKMDEAAMAKADYDAGGDVLDAGGMKAYVAAQIEAFKATLMTTAAMNLYVAPTGSDTTGDGSAASPYKTINFALSTVPKILNHNVTINVAAGNYTAEGLITVHGFLGQGTLNIFGGADLAAAPSYVIERIYVKSCSCFVHVRGLRGTANATWDAGTTFLVKGATIVQFNVCVSDVAKTSTIDYNFGFSSVNGSYVHCSGCKASNKGRAFYASYGGKLYARSCSGSGNTASYVGEAGGTIHYSASTVAPAATIGYVGGGLIVKPSGGTVGT